ncbi:MAG: CehA/McbA family metallohydrolase [Myxococcota bacterium]
MTPVLPWLLGCGRSAPDPVPPAPPLAERAPRTADLVTYREMWEDLQAARAPSDGGGRIVDVSVPQRVVVDSPVTIDATLEVGPEGIAEGGTVTITPSPFWGWTPPSTSRGAPGFTRVTGPQDVALRPEAVAGMLVVTVGGRALRPGERVHVVYGEGDTARADRFAEAAPALWFAVDGDGDGVRAVVGAVDVTTVAGPPAQLVATLPSVARPGQTVALRLAALDRAGNAFGPAPGTVTLRGSPGLSLPDSVALDPDGLARVPVTVAAPGIHTVQVALGGMATRSNPLVARDGAEGLLWGDLQVHTARSDGTGAPADVLRYAREVAGLDVVALTDHDHWGMRFLDAAPALVAAEFDAVEAANAPGAFVALHGYEWTSWVWGHRHVLWFDAARRPWPSSLDPRYDEPAELHAALAGQPAVVVRHHPAGGPVAVDWSVPMDPVLEPVVEIASVHGQSESPDLPGVIYDTVPEAFVDRQLAGGADFGVIGSTDGHDGHPGLSQLVGGQGGLVALVGAEPTRASVLATLRARHVYATNGPRIVLRFDVAGVAMGGEAPAAERAVATVRVVGTAPIDRVELVGRDGVVGSRRGEGSALLFAEIATAARAGDLLYVRVVQVDGGIAWSSGVRIR